MARQLARRNPSALAVARHDPLGRVAVPMLAIAAGATAGLLVAKPLGRSSMASGLTGGALGLATFLLVDTLDQRR